MRDLHSTAGRKQYIENSDDLLTLVRAKYPDALVEGSIGAKSYQQRGELVAEAWLHAQKPGWWLRIKPA
jgi:hypothetical protein